MTVTLTTLCENMSGIQKILAEWGQSILIETRDVSILFDTGRTTVALMNADHLGIDLAKIDTIVLSHSHVDHTGGLRGFLQRMGQKTIVAHPAVWEKKYTKRQHEPDIVYNGIPFAREELESLGGSFVLTREPYALSDTIMTTGEVEMTTDYEHVEDNIFVKSGGRFVRDPLPDDLAIIIRTEEGLVIVLGCAHRGAVNTIRHAQNITGEARVYAVIGGSHLYRASEERIKRTIDDMRQAGVQKIGLSHCTGFRASMMFARAFGDDFFPNYAGTKITLP